MHVSQALTNTIYDYTTALYWMGLNFATLCRLGGGATWTADQAKRIAEEALEKCMKEREEKGAPAAKIADTLFAQSVLKFCLAEAYTKNYISKDEEDDLVSSDALYKKSYAMLKEVLERYDNVLGGKHLESIKCLTMLSLIARKTGMIKEAMEWCKREVSLRQEVRVIQPWNILQPPFSLPGLAPPFLSWRIPIPKSFSRPPWFHGSLFCIHACCVGTLAPTNSRFLLG